MFDEEAMIDGDLNILNSGSLTDIWHEPIQLGLIKGIVVSQPHLSKKVIIVQVVEEFVSQNFHPILIRLVN